MEYESLAGLRTRAESKLLAGLRTRAESEFFAVKDPSRV